MPRLVRMAEHQVGHALPEQRLELAVDEDLVEVAELEPPLAAEHLVQDRLAGILAPEVLPGDVAREQVLPEALLRQLGGEAGGDSDDPSQGGERADQPERAEPRDQGSLEVD